MHREESVAVTIYLSGSVGDVVQFLEDFGRRHPQRGRSLRPVGPSGAGI